MISPTPQALYRLLPALLVLTATSCRESDRPEPAATAQPTAKPEQIVALVNEAPILAADLAFQMQGGDDRQTALRSLIQAELLAQEAARRGLDQDPEVQRTRRRAMAHALVRKMYGESFTHADIPREMVERSYKINKIRFVHPEMVKVTHILATLPASAPAKQQQQAKALAERVHHAALDNAPLDEKGFKALAKQLQETAPEIKLRAESLTTPLRGFTVAEFADAAFALSRPGQISPVVKTSYGYHVIYLEERLPAENRSLAEAEDEIRRRIFDEARQQLLLSWIEQLEQQQSVSVNQEVLERSLSQSPES